MEDFEWNVSNETKLFELLVDHKPVGVNKYFQMALLWTKLQDYFDISSERIWQHLETMYNMESLDDIESLPFPNDEKDFYLPEVEYGALKLKKEEVKSEEKTIKPYLVKKEMKESPKINKEPKKIDDKTPKKETPRRDSKDGKTEPKTPVTIKKESKKEIEKTKQIKGKTPNAKDEDKMKTPKMEERKIVKRPTRGSMKPDETNNRKSQSPLTVTPTSTAKRRRI